MSSQIAPQSLRTLPPSIVAAVLLLLAIPSGWPYGYYQLLRFVVCGISAFMAYRAFEVNPQGWGWVLAFTAILFNPIIPVHLDKGTWSVIDLTVAIGLPIGAILIDKSR